MLPRFRQTHDWCTNGPGAGSINPIIPWSMCEGSSQERCVILFLSLTMFSDKYKITHLSCELPSHIDHGIIGLMDPAPGPFVHQSWVWRKRGSIHAQAQLVVA